MDNNGSHPVRSESHTGMKLLSWLALLLSLLALGLAYMAYQRTGANLKTDVQQGANQAEDAAGNAASKAGDKAQDAGQAIDAGPDGVDEDDTQTGGGTQGGTTQTAPTAPAQ